MDMIWTLFSYFYQFLESSSFLLLAALGMAIIYGMMGITNLAQGEFILLGAYFTAIFAQALHFPLAVAILCASFVTGVFGLIIDRIVIKRLYDRPMDSVVATWGISLLIAQSVFIILGPTYTGVPIPFGAFTLGARSYSYYRLLLVVIAGVLILGMYLLFNHTKIGLHSRATMQNREIANSLGVNSDLMNAGTFMLGAALAGLCGGLYMPTMSLTPALGESFLVQSFVTVLVGGSEPLLGTVLASGGLGLVEGSLSLLFNTFYAKIGILLMAIIFIRITPDGFAGAYHFIKMRKEAKKMKKVRALQ